MLDVVGRRALPGRSRSSHDKMARGLGYFSIALGIAELAVPGAICRAAGARGLENVVRGYGARELATGVAILTSHDPEPWIWTRVAGDLVDIATVATGRGQDDWSRARSTLALATLAAVTFVDLACANGLNGETGNRKTAIRDYSRRSGFPGGLQVARGGAQNFKIPDDMRTPELLRPWDTWLADGKPDQGRTIAASSDSRQEAFHGQEISRLSAAHRGTRHASPPRVQKRKRQMNSAAQATSASTTAVVNALPLPPAFRACSISPIETFSLLLLAA